MKPIIALVSIFLLIGLAGCNQQEDQNTQPEIGINRGQSIETHDIGNMKSQDKSYAQPYNYNYNGSYTGAENTSFTEEVRSSQQVASRASEAAESAEGVERAVSVAQGMDIVVAVETRNKERNKAIEEEVRRIISEQETGYNVYVSTDNEINENILRLFSAMNNVKTSFVTHGVSEIIYQIGQKNGDS